MQSAGTEAIRTLLIGTMLGAVALASSVASAAGGITYAASARYGPAAETIGAERYAAADEGITAEQTVGGVFVPHDWFWGPVIVDAADFDVECGVLSGSPDYVGGKHVGDLLIDDVVDIETYRCVTWVTGDLTIDPDWAAGSETVPDATCPQTPCVRSGLAILPWLHAVGGDVTLIARYSRSEVRMPRLYRVGGDVEVDGELGHTLWRSRSFAEHAGTIHAAGRYGVDLRGFDDLVELDRLEIHAPENANVGQQYISIWKGLASLELLGSLDIDVDEGAAHPGFLASLDEVQGSAVIDVRQSLFGLSNLRRVGGTLDVYLYDAWEVGYVTGLESLEEVGGDFIWDPSGSTLHSLTGLSSLTSVGGDFEPPLSVSSLAGLESLTFVGGDLTLTGQIGWGQDLSPLAALAQVGGRLTVEDFAVSSLNGLQGLQSVGGLRIHDNPVLSSVSALHGVAVTNDGFVQITDNTPLTTCSAVSLVAQIQATGWSGASNTSGNQSCMIFRAPIKLPTRMR